MQDDEGPASTLPRACVAGRIQQRYTELAGELLGHRHGATLTPPRVPRAADRVLDDLGPAYERVEDGASSSRWTASTRSQRWPWLIVWMSPCTSTAAPPDRRSAFATCKAPLGSPRDSRLWS